jgi:hypothetical protein
VLPSTKENFIIFIMVHEIRTLAFSATRHIHKLKTPSGAEGRGMSQASGESKEQKGVFLLAVECGNINKRAAPSFAAFCPHVANVLTGVPRSSLVIGQYSSFQCCRFVQQVLHINS